MNASHATSFKIRFFLVMIVKAFLKRRMNELYSEMINDPKAFIFLFLTHHNYVWILIRILYDAERHLSCRICFCINLSLRYVVKFDKDLLDELRELFQNKKSFR